MLTGGGALLDGMVEIAEQVFDAPVRVGYPERDRFGGLVEDIQSPSWAAAAGLALVSQRAHALEHRAEHDETWRQRTLNALRFQVSQSF